MEKANIVLEIPLLMMDIIKYMFLSREVEDYCRIYTNLVRCTDHKDKVSIFEMLCRNFQYS